MKKRDQTSPRKTDRTATEAALTHRPTASSLPAEAPPPAFEWQAVLLRYLPDPRGAPHAVKRFALR